MNYELQGFEIIDYRLFIDSTDFIERSKEIQQQGGNNFFVFRR
jgi:hypothetical protein